MSVFVKAHELMLPYLAKVPVFYTAEQTIIAMFALMFISKTVHAALSFLLNKKYDNVQASFRYGATNKNGAPLTWQQKTVQRAYSAHQNHIEAFTYFSVAMLLALLKLPTSAHAELALLGNAFLLVRVLYNAVYVIAFNEPLSFLRSAVFLTGIVIVVRIFTLAVTA